MALSAAGTAPPTVPTRPRWWRRRPAVLVALTATVLLLPAGGWWVATAATADRVLVEVSVERCANTPVQNRLVADGAGQTARQRVFVVTPRTRCSLTVRVINHGPFDVHLQRGVAPGLGPVGGGVLEATVLVDGEPDPAPDPGSSDASVRLAEDLPAGRSTGFRIVLTARDDGCTAGVTTVEGWPRVELSALGRDLSVAGATDLAFRWRTAQNPGCDT